MTVRELVAMLQAENQDAEVGVTLLGASTAKGPEEAEWGTAFVDGGVYHTEDGGLVLINEAEQGVEYEGFYDEGTGGAKGVTVYPSGKSSSRESKKGIDGVIDEMLKGK